MALPFIREDFQCEAEYSLSPAEFLGYDVYFMASRITDPEDILRERARNSVAEDKKVVIDEKEELNGAMEDSLSEVTSDSVGEEKRVLADEKKKVKKTGMEHSVNKIHINSDDEEETVVGDDKENMKKTRTEDSVRETARNWVGEEENVVANEKVKTTMDDDRRVSKNKNQRISSGKVSLAWRAPNPSEHVYKETIQKTEDSAKETAGNSSVQEEKFVIDDEKGNIILEDDQRPVSKNKKQSFSSSKDFRSSRAQNPRKYNYKEKIQKPEDSVMEMARNSAVKEGIVMACEKANITEDDQRDFIITSSEGFRACLARNPRKYREVQRN